MAHKIDSASGSITLISEDGSGNVNLTLPRAGLGTAASADTGTAAGNIPVLDGSGQIASGVLSNAAVADNAITLAKMAGGTDGNLITYDASGDPAYVTTGTSGQVLTSGGVGVAPTFQTSTHTPDDNSVTLAKMAHGTDGELITYDATGAPANVAVGTSGQVLTSGGAGVAPTFQAAAGGGKVLQVLQSVVTDTISQSGGGTGVFTDISGFSISITPSSTTSKILIMVEANASCSSTGEHFGINLLRGSTVLGGHTSLSNRSPALMSHMTTGATNKVMALGGTFLDSPSTTSATTYKVQSYSTSQTFYLNRTSSYSDNNHRLHGISTITVMEIGA